MSRQVRAVLPVLVLLVAACWALSSYVDVTLQDRPGVRLKLPARLGGWTGHELRFCHEASCKKEHRVEDLGGDPTKCPACGAGLHAMTVEEYEQLPKDTEFIKAIYQNGAGESVYVSIVLTGRDRESIHRPERCLTGQGHTILSRDVRAFPMQGRDPLKAMVFTNERRIETAQGAYGYLSYYAYWFVGQNRETPDHYMRMFWLAWDRVVHSVAHRWAYISVSGRRDKDSDEYLRQLGDFLPLLHGAIVLRPGEEPAPGGADQSAATRNPVSAPR